MYMLKDDLYEFFGSNEGATFDDVDDEELEEIDELEDEDLQIN